MENIPVGANELPPNEINTPSENLAVIWTDANNLPVPYDQALASQQYEAQKLPVTKLTEKEWASVMQYTLLSDKVSPESFMGDLGLDRTAAQSVFEELQDQGIVTKHFIPKPGKGAVRSHGHDESRFNGYMVLYGYGEDGIERAKHDPEFDALIKRQRGYKRPATKPKYEESVEYDRPKDSKHGAVNDYYHLNMHRLAGIQDVLQGHRSKRAANESLKADHEYQEIFDKNHSERLSDGTEKFNVPKWMENKVSVWRRTAPRVEIIPEPTPNQPGDDGLTNAEREVDTEIRNLRSRGMSNSAIKKRLLKEYHPDAPGGGDLEKAQRTTIRLTKILGRSAVGTKPVVDVEEIINSVIEEQNGSGTQSAREQVDDGEANANKAPQTEKSRLFTDPIEFGLRFVAGETRKDVEEATPFPRMSRESLSHAFGRNNLPESSVGVVYSYLRSEGVIHEDGSVDAEKLQELLDAYRS